MNKIYPWCRKNSALSGFLWDSIRNHPKWWPHQRFAIPSRSFYKLFDLLSLMIQRYAASHLNIIATKSPHKGSQRLSQTFIQYSEHWSLYLCDSITMATLSGLALTSPSNLLWSLHYHFLTYTSLAMQSPSSFLSFMLRSAVFSTKLYLL